MPLVVVLGGFRKTSVEDENIRTVRETYNAGITSIYNVRWYDIDLAATRLPLVVS
jgi:hypothetical protein